MLNPKIDRRPVSGARKTLAATLLLVAAAAIAAASAAGAGAPSGVLKDPMGRVLPGAMVRLSAIVGDGIHETQSDATGTFQFPEIPDGEYMLSTRLPGFRTTHQRMTVGSGMPPLDMTLQVGTLSETVTVVAGPNALASASAAAPAKPMPPAPACGSTNLGGNLKPPMKLKTVHPRYKPEWLSAGLAGNVLLQATIGVDGKVRNVEQVSGVSLDLSEEAVRAVSQWEFSPTYLNCGAIEVRMFVTVAFKAEP